MKNNISNIPTPHQFSVWRNNYIENLAQNIVNDIMMSAALASPDDRAAMKFTGMIDGDCQKEVLEKITSIFSQKYWTFRLGERTIVGERSSYYEYTLVSSVPNLKLVGADDPE